jgi:mRNA-degrading endonuclease RelE of RelBE toxin-antitoxin system
VKVRFADRADKDYAALRPEIRKAFAKQLGFLTGSPIASVLAGEKIRRSE